MRALTYSTETQLLQPHAPHAPDYNVFKQIIWACGDWKGVTATKEREVWRSHTQLPARQLTSLKELCGRELRL